MTRLTDYLWHLIFGTIAVPMRQGSKIKMLPPISARVQDRDGVGMLVGVVLLHCSSEAGSGHSGNTGI